MQPWKRLEFRMHTHATARGVQLCCVNRRGVRVSCLVSLLSLIVCLCVFWNQSHRRMSKCCSAPASLRPSTTNEAAGRRRCCTVAAAALLPLSATGSVCVKHLGCLLSAVRACVLFCVSCVQLREMKNVNTHMNIMLSFLSDGVEEQFFFLLVF